MEFQIVDPVTLQETWEVYETMQLSESSVDQIIDRAYMYIGRPERYQNVQAIRLNADITAIERETDFSGLHEDTLTFHVSVLRKRTNPVSH